MELDADLEGIDLTKGIPPPSHPPPLGPEREEWPGWAAWDQHCKLVQQHTRLNDLGQYTGPCLNYYYGLDEEHLGSISLPDFDWPKPPDYENYSYDEVHEYLREAYRIILEVALPRNPDRCGEHRTRQTTLGRYVQPYQSLQVSDSTSTIRLLEIFPSAHDGEPISARLFLADLDADGRVPYEALSYTWGEKSSDGQRHYVHVNGYKQPVTPNLHSALSSLRDPCRSRTIWADSICINQADVQERGQQVTLMARIYTEASRVLVHLGPPIPSSAALFATLQRLADSTGDDTGTDADHDHHHHHDHDDDSDDKGDGGSTDPAFWDMCYDAGPDLVDGFIELCTRSWWTRMWVLQEYTLNKRDPIFYCGRLTISNFTLNKNFNKLYEWVEHKKRHPIALLEDCSHAACARPDKDGKDEAKSTAEGTGAPDKNDPKDKRRMIRAQGSRGREWSAWGNRVWRANHVLARRVHCSPFSMPFYSTLGLQSRCTIPHDAVYGLRELMDQLFRSLFPPDYTVPLSVLFSRLAAYLLIVDLNMNIFWFFPHRLRDRTLGGGGDSQTRGDVVVPSWVPDFTRPRAIREAEAMPHPSKPQPELWHHAPHIFDRVLFMNGFLLDEIVAVYPLPPDDPFLLLQQLWYVERTYLDPDYLRDADPDDDEDEEERPRKDNFDRMVDLLRGVTAWASIAWAAEHPKRLDFEVSIVEVIKGLTNLSPLIIPSAEKYQDKVPDVVDLIIGKEQNSAERASVDEEDLDTATSDLTQAVDAIDLTSDDADSSSSTPKPSRRVRILEMQRRLNNLALFLIEEPTWTDFIGICAFDYHNFRAQVLHRLCIVSAQVAGDKLGDSPGLERLRTGLGPRYQTSECAATHEPLSYRKFIDAIVDGACHPLEVRLREGFVIDWAAKIHKVMADMVGLEGETAFRPVGRGVPVQDNSEKKAMEASRNFICMVPIPYSESEGDGEEDETDETDLSFLGLPHCEEGHPFGAYYRWKFLPRKVRYDVHTTLQCVVELLAGREFFVTETGLAGLAGVDTRGVQDGDDLFLIEGMSNPLIARLEPSPQLGTPKKRRREMSTRGMRREIVGTSVVKGIDTKDGNVDKATWPSWFEPLVEKRGRYRFC